MSSPFTLNFRHGGSSHTLGGGQRFSAPREAGFRDTPTNEMQSILAEVQSGEPWQNVVTRRFSTSKPWLYSIISDPCRTEFFKSVLPEHNGIAMDLGAGWGQIARPLAIHRPVVAVEPVAERLSFIEESAKQDGVHGNLTYVEADYLELDFETRFTTICAIGVLEWVGAFQNHTDPQQRQRNFLRKIRSELMDGGHLILGIENRVGLKYLLGCPDDHLGVPGIACLPAPLARERWRATAGHDLSSFTYSQFELRQLLAEAGFSHIDFFAAFPDYKLPKLILPFGTDGREIDQWLANRTPPVEHNGYDGSPLTKEFSEALNAHYRTLALEGAAHPFVPSFFVRAR